MLVLVLVPVPVLMLMPVLVRRRRRRRRWRPRRLRPQAVEARASDTGVNTVVGGTPQPARGAVGARGHLCGAAAGPECRHLRAQRCQLPLRRLRWVRGVNLPAITPPLPL